ncbi:MAG: hypothetical protein R2708_12560 [Vicinamibacterales bacterium]
MRRVRGGFARLADGVRALAQATPRPRLVARSVVQRANAAVLAGTVRAVAQAGFDAVSFLAADLSSPAFNRPQPWDAGRAAEVAVPAAELPALAAAIQRVSSECRDLLARGFVEGGRASLERVHAYYAAAAGLGPFPPVRCNAPWVSAVLEPDGALRPCFFLPAYGTLDRRLDLAINTPSAVAFRRGLDVASHPTCRRCVCSLHLPDGADMAGIARPEPARASPAPQADSRVPASDA